MNSLVVIVGTIIGIALITLVYQAEKYGYFEERTPRVLALESTSIVVAIIFGLYWVHFVAEWIFRL